MLITFTAISPTWMPPALPDVQTFFRTYYVPNNAVLLILGDVNVADGFSLAEKYFGKHSCRTATAICRPDWKPQQVEERRGHVVEKFGTLPANGRRLCDASAVAHPIGAPWLCSIKLCTAGAPGRVYRELVLEKQIAVEADGGVDDIFGYDGPSQMTTRIFHKPEISSEDTLAAFDQLVRIMQEKGISDSELDQLKNKMAL